MKGEQEPSLIDSFNSSFVIPLPLSEITTYFSLPDAYISIIFAPADMLLSTISAIAVSKE